MNLHVLYFFFWGEREALPLTDLKIHVYTSQSSNLAWIEVQGSRGWLFGGRVMESHRFFFVLGTFFCIWMVWRWVTGKWWCVCFFFWFFLGGPFCKSNRNIIGRKWLMSNLTKKPVHGLNNLIRMWISQQLVGYCRIPGARSFFWPFFFFASIEPWKSNHLQSSHLKRTCFIRNSFWILSLNQPGMKLPVFLLPRWDMFVPWRVSHDGSMGPALLV